MSEAIKKFEKSSTTVPDLSVEEYDKKMAAMGLGPAPKPPEKVEFQFTEAETDLPAGGPTGATGAGDNQAMKDIGKGAAQGVQELGKNIVNFGIETFDAMENFASSKLGIGTGDIVNDSSRVKWGESLGTSEDSLTTKATQAIVKNGIPLVASMGVGVGIKAALAAGAAIDLVAMDPHQDRLSDLILKEAPGAKNIPIIGNFMDYLQNDKNDSNMEGRFKNMLENLGIGAAVGGILRGTQKVSNGWQKYKTAAKAADREAVFTAAMTAEQKIAAAAPEVLDEATLAAKEIKMAEESAILDAQVKQVLGDSTTVATQVGEEVVPNLQNASVADYVNQFYKEFPQADLERAPKVWSELSTEAQAIVKNPDALLAWKQGTRPLTDAEVKATQYMIHQISEDVVETAVRYAGAKTPEGLAAFGEKMNAFKLMNNLDDGAGSASGASLQAHKILQSMDMTVDDFTKAMTNEGKQRFIKDNLKFMGEKDLSTLAETLAAFKDIKDINKAQALLEMSRQPTLKKASEILQFTAINGMLSSPTTTVANFLSNLTTTTKSMIDNYVSAGIGTALRSEDRMTFALATQQLNAGMMATGEAFKNSWRALRGETPTIASTMKVEFARINPISAEAIGMDVDKNGILAKVVDGVGMTIGAPVKVNATADAFFSTINYRSKMMEMASDEASRITEIAKRGGAVPEAFKDMNQSQLMDYFLNKNTMRMHEGAMEHAQTLSFSNALPVDDMLGKIATGLDNAIEATPQGRVIFPFFKTNANIIDYSIKNSPFAPLLSGTVRAEISAGGRARDMALAKISTGTTFMGIAAWAASNGLVTGPKPENYKVTKALEESQKGWQPDSVKVGDNYYAMNRIDPMSSFLRLGAVVSASRNFLADDEYQALAHVAGAAVVDFMTPEMMVDSVGRFFEAYNDATKYGQDDGKKAGAMLAELGARYIPFSALQRNIRNQVDPYKAAAGNVDGFTDQLMRRLSNTVPWMSKNLPIDRNMFGEPLLVPAGLGPDFLSPIAESKGESSELVQRLKFLAQYKEELGPNNELLDAPVLSVAPKTFTFKGADIQLTPAEYERYALLRGGLDPESGEPFMPTLRDTMAQVTDAVWGELKDGQMSPMAYNKLMGQLSKVVSKYGEVAKAKMMENPEFRQKWQNAVQVLTEDQNLMDATDSDELGN